jgi:hypothetical protein
MTINESSTIQESLRDGQLRLQEQIGQLTATIAATFQKPAQRPGILTSNFLTFFILAASATVLAWHGTITGEMWTGAVVVTGLGYMGFRTAQVSKANGAT